MDKLFSVCAAFIALTLGANAQQQEAVLRKLEVPGAAFDIVVAMPKPGANPIYDLSEAPDALVIPLVGGELMLVFDDAQKMVQTLDILGRPIGSLQLQSPDGKSRIPLIMYIVRTGE